MSVWSIILCNLYCKPVHGGSSDLELTFLWCFVWLGIWTHQTSDIGANKSTFYSQNYTSWWKNGCSCFYKFCVYTDWVVCALCLQRNGRWLGINNHTFSTYFPSVCIIPSALRSYHLVQTIWIQIPSILLWCFSCICASSSFCIVYMFIFWNANHALWPNCYCHLMNLNCWCDHMNQSDDSCEGWKFC